MLVTGASSGIGAAIARHLAGRGFRVFGTVRRAADGAALARDGVTPVEMDVTDTESIARGRREVERVLAGVPLAGLVNNAGIPAAGPLELLPVDELRRVFEVNVFGPVAVTQAFLPLLKAARGRIVNISSVAGRSVLPFMSPYAASKFALEAISDALRRELRPFGVAVTVIEPGSFRSKIWNKVEAMDLARYRGSAYEQVLERFRAAALRGAERAPPPDKVAGAVGRALTTRRAPIRVLVVHGWRARLWLWLPDRWMDWLIYRAVWKGAGSAREGQRRSAPRSPGS